MLARINIVPKQRGRVRWGGSMSERLISGRLSLGLRDDNRAAEGQKEWDPRFRGFEDGLRKSARYSATFRVG